MYVKFLFWDLDKWLHKTGGLLIQVAFITDSAVDIFFAFVDISLLTMLAFSYISVSDCFHQVEDNQFLMCVSSGLNSQAK